MSSQPQDMNALLHAMRTQIAALTSQLTEIQANPPVATPSVEKKFNKKVEVVADPGAFKGDRAGLGNEHAVELLERNVNPCIAEQIYLQDTRSDNLALAAKEVRQVGRAIELYTMHQGGGSTKQNNISQRRPGSSNQNQNHSHGFRPFGLQPGQGAPMDIGVVQGGQMRRFKGACYNCGQEGHMSQDCRKGAQAAQQKNNQGRQARQLETEKPDDRLNSLAGRSYDKIWAFFYDQQVNEMKAQGKAFGA
ncbi:hypothetical protein SERLA73DRAFT_72508 [Serpula lacrymans var. lacrymans S7.3]|uniref:CCHC-type domain-containing protein n=1 Tax=Serpula lacrymans var. lacrymans (strain S7.3) TaxID=936435 RepID=F8PUU4_SERL3|nr:hypothetical protein SERLA73DRAFT_72508 [Serpula lacrymans var. lacrymans S7.3]